MLYLGGWLTLCRGLEDGCGRAEVGVSEGRVLGFAADYVGSKEVHDAAVEVHAGSTPLVDRLGGQLRVANSLEVQHCTGCSFRVSYTFWEAVDQVQQLLVFRERESWWRRPRHIRISQHDESFRVYGAQPTKIHESFVLGCYYPFRPDEFILGLVKAYSVRLFWDGESWRIFKRAHNPMMNAKTAKIRNEVETNCRNVVLAHC